MQNDLISRSALIEHMCRGCTSRCNLDDECCCSVDAVEKAPAVDAVEVVRCEDCKWLYDGPDMYCCTKHTGLALIKPDGSSFCSYGERRADDG